jgi:predicted lysophospholipase L1 biosynthesis ABC-type transport system permease subunit
MVIASLLLLLLVTYVVSLTVRVRRHDLAVLRALGYRARQLRIPLVWSSVLPVLGGLVVGVPVGLFLGSLLWDHVTEPIGLVYRGSVGPRVLVLAALTLLVAAIVPLALSRRVRTARVTEILRVD